MGDYLKVIITVEPSNPWCDVLVQDLGDLGFESFETIDSKLYAYIPENYFDLGKYETLVKAYSDRVQISTGFEQVKKENWNKEWESNYHAIEVADKIYIRAVFHDPNPTFEYDILITPKMSFGTGHHATTKLMLTEMLNVDFKGKNVLDVGCGTGILSILAKILGAKDVFGIDIDDWAVENANENIGLNKCTDVIIEKGEISDVIKKPYNVILANINYNVILNDLQKYTLHLESKGELLLSGFFHEQKNDLLNATKNLGLQFKNDITMGEWTMLHLIKNR